MRRVHAVIAFADTTAARATAVASPAPPLTAPDASRRRPIVGPVPIPNGVRSGVAPAWLAPSVVAATGLAGAAYVATVDPARRGVFPTCPFHRLTGLWCPGCGTTRALHQLLTGHVATALGSNLFAPLLVVLGGYLWLSWLWPAMRLGRLPNLARIPSPVWTGLVAAVVVYGILRNLAPFAVLAP
jgi:Protein of unknown function (DUF2752)